MEREGIDIRYFMWMLSRRWWVVLLSFVLVMAFTVYKIYTTSPVYQATALMKVETRQYIPLMGGYQRAYSGTAMHAYALRSLPLLERVWRALSEEEKKCYPTVGSLRGNVVASPHRVSGLVSLTVRGPDPDVCASVANKIVDIYSEYNLEQKKDQARRVREFVETQLRYVEQRLRAAEDSLVKYQQRYGLVVLDKNKELLLTRLFSLEDQYQGVLMERQVLEREIELLKKEMEGDFSTGVMEELVLSLIHI